MAQEKKDKKVCFVIAPIGDGGSDTRKHSDQVLKHIVTPAVESLDYKVLRADGIEKPGMITSQVIQHIVNEPLVIADLSGWNPNVFYELAIRHAIRKPVIQLINKGERIPFDVAGSRTIHIDLQDLDSAADAKKEIIAQAKALEEEPSEIETPISVSLDLQFLRQSEKPEERSIGDILALVSELKSSVNKLETKLGVQDGEGVLDEIHSALRNLQRRVDKFSFEPFNFRQMRFHPAMIEELFLFSGRSKQSSTPALFFLASIMRNFAPWASEMLIEIAKLIRQGETEAARDLARDLFEISEGISRGPWPEMMGGKDGYIMFREMERFLHRALDDFISTRRISTRANRKKAPPT